MHYGILIAVVKVIAGNPMWYNDTVKIQDFSCILIWRFWSVEISLHFNLAFS